MPGISVKIKGKSSAGEELGPVLVDKVTEALASIGIPQCQVHIGAMFAVHSFDEDVADDGTVEWLISVGSVNDVYCTFSLTSTGSSLLEIFETPTTTEDGSGLASVDRNRSTDNSSTTSVFMGPTISVDGTIIDAIFVGGGNIGANTIGGDTMSPVGLVLPQGNYLLRATNKAGAAADIFIHMDYYEGIAQ